MFQIYLKRGFILLGGMFCTCLVGTVCLCSSSRALFSCWSSVWLLYSLLSVGYSGLYYFGIAMYFSLQFKAQIFIIGVSSWWIYYIFLVTHSDSLISYITLVLLWLPFAWNMFFILYFRSMCVLRYKVSLL